MELSKQNIIKSERWIMNNYPSFYDLIERSFDGITWREKLYLHINNAQIPKCYCGNTTKFININKGFRTYCSRKCLSNNKLIKEKRTKTCLKKYGVENPMKNNTIKSKLRLSILDKYGVDNISKLNHIKDIKKDKMILNYGVEYNSQRPEIKNKLSANMIKLNLSLNENRSSKRFDYWINKLSKIGIQFIKNESSILTIRCQQGHDYQIKRGYLNDRIMNKTPLCTICNPINQIVKTVFDHQSFLKKSKTIHNDKYEYLSLYEKSDTEMDILCKKCNKKFKLKPSHHLNNMMGCPMCNSGSSIKESLWLNSLKIPEKNRQVRIKINNKNYVVDGIDYENKIIYEFYGDYWHGNPNIFNKQDINKTINKTFGEIYQKTIKREGEFIENGYKIISIWENDYVINNNHSEIFSFLSTNYFGEIVNNYTDEYLIDFYLPEIKVGIVFNSIYYQSDSFISPKHNKNKILYFKNKGIKIINIWEDEWIHKIEIIKSQIKYLLKSKDIKSIYARKCKIKLIDQKTAKKFLSQNHIQGYATSVYAAGIFDGNNLVSIMSFENTEGRKHMNNNGWNMNRFCSLLNTSVIGGFSKLLKYFIKSVNPNKIISYADSSWSDGDVYNKNGFLLKNSLDPDYKWVVNNKRINKQKFKKSNLVRQGYDINKSESEIMKDNGYYKIWDFGKIKYEWENTQNG